MEHPMTHWQTVHARTVRPGRDILSPPIVLAALAAAAAVPLLLLASLLPPLLVLPVLSLAALAVAGGLSLAAWWRRAPRRADTITLWDLAGAAALIGFAAGMLTGPDHILHLINHPVMAQ
jgi:hypothetical protein